MRDALEWLRDDLPCYVASALLAVGVVVVYAVSAAWMLICVLAKPAAAVACTALICWAVLKALGAIA